MKYIEANEEWRLPVVELTEHNLRTLLAKLKDPHSHHAIIDEDWKIVVRAVDDSAHYKTRPPGEMAHAPEEDV